MDESLKNSDIAFIAVGTQTGDDGSADLQYVLRLLNLLAKLCKKTDYSDKSTVPVGTADKVRSTIQKELDIRNSNLEFDVVSNPEFLKEGVAIADFT